MPEPEQPTTPETPAAKYTDRDVDKFKGDARGEGREAAINDLLKKTGADSIDDVLVAYTEYQGIQEAVTTEADREKERADKLQTKLQAAEQRAEKAETLAQDRLVDAEMRSAMLEAGVPPDRVNSALRLAGRDAVKVGEDGTVEGISEAVEALKGSDSYLFEAPKPTARRTAPDVNTPAPEAMDVSAMSGEEFAKLQEKVMRGETVMPASPETAVAAQT